MTKKKKRRGQTLVINNVPRPIISGQVTAVTLGTELYWHTLLRTLILQYYPATREDVIIDFWRDAVVGPNRLLKEGFSGHNLVPTTPFPSLKREHWLR